MTLTGAQLDLWVSCILDGFPAKEDLQGLAQSARSKNLDQLALGPNLQVIVEQLVGRAAADGWLPDLLKAARELRANNEALKELERKFRPALLAAVADPFDAPLLRGDRPLVNRKALRLKLRGLNSAGGNSILVVGGDPISGKSHSTQFIRHLADRLSTFRVVWVDLVRLVGEHPDEASVAALPELLAESLCDQMGLQGVPSRQSEQHTRWVQRFCNWLTGELEGNSTVRWIVLDGFNKIPVPAHTRQLVRELAVRIDNNLSGCRLVLLGWDDVDEIKAEIPGGVEHEQITPISPADLLEFFLAIYEERQRRDGTTFTATDVAGSVARVQRAVDFNQPRHLYALADAVAAEAKRILSGEPAP